MNTIKIIINEFKNQLYYFASWIYILILLTNLDNSYYDYYPYIVYISPDNKFILLLWIAHFLVSFLYKNKKVKLILFIFILFLYFLLIDHVDYILDENMEFKKYYLLFYNIMFCLYCMNILYFLCKLKLWMKNLRQKKENLNIL
jgi:hypothetical protein